MMNNELRTSRAMASKDICERQDIKSLLQSPLKNVEKLQQALA